MTDWNMTFHKLTAAGNDFICVDNTKGKYDSLLDSDRLAGFVRRLCHRALGAGADGVIFAGPTGNGQGVDIVARFFEPDGNEARLCGNGTACFSQWAVRQGLIQRGDEVTILTAAGTARCKYADDPRGRPVVCIPDPHGLERNLLMQDSDRNFNLHYINIGVPHGVVFMEDEKLEDCDVHRWGRALRYHRRFAPEGVNVDFVRVFDEGRIAVRTYEFGVEGETLACGTGASAAAILAMMNGEWPEAYQRGDKPVEVAVQSGENLLVWADIRDDESITDVCLETPVQRIYEGKLDESFVRRYSGGNICGDAVRRSEFR